VESRSVSAATSLRAARATAINRAMGMDDLFPDQQRNLEQLSGGPPSSRWGHEMLPAELIRFNTVRHARIVQIQGAALGGCQRIL
jgi:hypothetical protein